MGYTELSILCYLRLPPKEESNVDHRREVGEELEGEEFDGEVFLTLSECSWLLWK